MKIIITVKDTDNIVGLKEDIAMRLEGVADIVRIDTADVVTKSEVEELIYKLECLLCHATGGKLSKYTYDLMTMEAVVTDYIDEAYSEGVENGYKKCSAEIFEKIKKWTQAKEG